MTNNDDGWIKISPIKFLDLYSAFRAIKYGRVIFRNSDKKKIYRYDDDPTEIAKCLVHMSKISIYNDETIAVEVDCTKGEKHEI